VYPTDTMYAIGCNALCNSAIERICRIKGLDPRRSELSVICSSLSQAAEYARIDNRAFRILKNHLPGPFTFILPASTSLPKVFKGRKAVGIRIPSNPIATEIAEQLGNPIMTTSIPYDDVDEAMNPESIAMNFEREAAVMIDGGDGTTDVSTIIDLTDSSDPTILRQGVAVAEL
ncbi:MAG: threonylcarbamoyl-AMP synthase, partial [Muribaculaceae bacterium]|nr:threonylcarbamoyl-AMP synthase [Muribaculaceae bacterium]